MRAILLIAVVAAGIALASDLTPSRGRPPLRRIVRFRAGSEGAAFAWLMEADDR